jgi:hypothetical protein
MRLKHIAFVFAAFIVTLVAGGISIALFENQTGGISRHFEKQNTTLFNTYAEFLIPKLSDSRLLDVTGPIKRTGAQSFQFHSGPFSSRFTTHIAIEGEKGEFILTVAGVYNNRKWRETIFEVTEPENPFTEEDFETSVTLEGVRDMGHFDPPDPPDPIEPIESLNLENDSGDAAQVDKAATP